MGWKKKVKKSIESFQKRIEEHEKKKEVYVKSGGKDYALVDYWEEEIKRLKQFMKDEEEKVDNHSK